MEIYLAHTQGFCAGVARAIEIVETVLKKYGTLLYVFHEIVHNKSVVEHFKTQGVQFIDSLDNVPDGSRLIFSAHGVSPEIIRQAGQKELKVIDATCPLVERIHRRAAQLSDEGADVVLIGHKDHEEVVGTKGYVADKLLHIVEKKDDVAALNIDPAKKVGFVTQTTLSMDDTKEIIGALKEKFANLVSPAASDICYATQNRQDAIKELCKKCNMIVVCGSANSSNSRRLKETAERYDATCILVDNANEFDPAILKDYERVGVSSGASVPQYIVDQVVQKIKERFQVKKIYLSKSPERKIKFSLPKI